MDDGFIVNFLWAFGFSLLCISLVSLYSDAGLIRFLLGLMLVVSVMLGWIFSQGDD